MNYQSIIKKQRLIKLEGLLQGLGFRPFVYHLAKKYQQNGWIANTSKGITLVIEGNDLQQGVFLEVLQNQLPPFAEIHSLSVQVQSRAYFKDFQIKPSAIFAEKSAFVLPDISPCSECIKDILNPQSRFYGYAFTSCCYCDPRYSIIKQQPYDRIRTSMAKFIACSRCETEYKDPENRRFHSQTIACPDCGPQLTQIGGVLSSLRMAINYLEQGKIIAVKGVGGNASKLDSKALIIKSFYRL